VPFFLIIWMGQLDIIPAPFSSIIYMIAHDQEVRRARGRPGLTLVWVPGRWT
jgi:hypothetical protein